jgi:three-Cys-motif partner protein
MPEAATAQSSGLGRIVRHPVVPLVGERRFAELRVMVCDRRAMGTEPLLWVREDHTKAKHDLLLAFFNKWVSVHSGHFTRLGRGRVRIYDGFAGPGVYAGGEPGSPHIMLEALLDNANLTDRWSSVRYEFSFVERDAGRARRLEEVLTEAEARARADGRWTDRVTWSVTCGLYEDNVPSDVPSPSALFLFIDPFGYSHSPMTLTKALVQQPKSDTLIFLPLSFVHRFADREGQDAALDRFFGTPSWRDVPNGPERPAVLLNLFKSQLVAAGLRWTGAFRLKPPEGGNEYWIVGASGHWLGYESIKEGFWAADPRNGQGFVTPKAGPPGQQSFGLDGVPEGPDTQPLLMMMRDHFAAQPFTVEDALEFTKTTRFLQTHVKTRTLAPAEKAGVLVVERPVGARMFPEGRGITMRFV